MAKNIIIVIAGLFILFGVLWIYNQRSENAGMRNSEMLTAERSDVATAEVAYFEDIRGFYAAPSRAGDYPGVVVIHEWWGLNDNIRDMARQLAGEGYHVLAVDLFGTVASTPDEARAQVSGLDQEQAVRNMRSAADFLRAEGATSIASLGWCFGGGQSLQLALSGEDLAATVIYYGNLVADQNRLSAIDWPVLGIFGAEDTSIPVSSVEEFQSALAGLNIQNEVYVYPGVGHAFANPSGMNYAPAETRDAWQKTISFLAENVR